MIRIASSITVFLATAVILWVSTPMTTALPASLAFAAAHTVLGVRRLDPTLRMFLTAAALLLAWAATGVGVVLPSSVLLPLSVFIAASTSGRIRWEAIFLGPPAAAAGGFLLIYDPSITAAGLQPSLIAVDIALMSVMVAAFYAGLLRRSEKHDVARRENYVHLLEELNQQSAALASQSERGRITAEIHDIVAHSLTVISSQARGARWLPPEAREDLNNVLETIEDASRAALTDMRAVLRPGGEAAPLEPLPGMSAVPGLLRRVRDSGLTVELQEIGMPRALAPAAELAVYRCLQESLTNVLRHAPQATTATVRLKWLPGQLDLVVVDDGGPPAVPEAGRGFNGMRDRLHALGGTLDIAPGPTGLRVSAMVPAANPARLTQESL
jgi:signal transduction histidine kinase